MRLTLKRIAKKKDYTIGRLYINGEYFCDTIEDTVRITAADSLSEMRRKKIQNKTAIPDGSYEVIITMSARFKKLLPLLLNVPAFEGVRIHSGNTAADTEGCIIVGKNDKVGWVSDSRNTMTKLMKILQGVEGKEKITLEIL